MTTNAGSDERNGSVWGLLAFAPAAWGVDSAPNGNRQVRLVVAARTKAAAHRALSDAAGGMSRYEFDQYAAITGNDEEVGAALSAPGRVFYQTSVTDQRAPFLPVPEGP